MPDSSGIVRAAYLRTASIALAAYEYLRTYLTAVDFYMVQWRKRKISVALVLFVLIRVTSITVIIISNIGFFYPHFTSESCSNYYLFSPILKVVQIMVSQCIMAVRTYNLSGRWKPMGVFLLALYASVCVLQWLSILINHHPEFLTFDPPVAGIRGSCLLAAVEQSFGSWVFYAVAIVFDFTVTIICAYYLAKYKRMVMATFLSNLINAMLYEGLLYFVGLTVTNIVNLILVQSSDVTVQKMGVSLLYVVVWILSQHIVLSQYRAEEKRRTSAHINVVRTLRRPQLAFSPEPASSSETRATYGDTPDRRGSRTITESFGLKTMGEVEEESDPLEAVTQARSAPPHTGVSDNLTQTPSGGGEMKRQERDDALV